MQELAGRLTALDADASASLKVISYFDALVAGGAGIESLVRAAVVLTGVAAGAETSGRVTRVDANGRRGDDGDRGDWPSSEVGGRTVWIERVGEAHANDAMVLDRLSLAVMIADARRGVPEAGAVEIVLDAGRPASERATALARLPLEAAGPVRVIAQQPDMPVAGPSALVADARGLVRAVLMTPSHAPGAGPAGYALASSADVLPQAWEDARLALRLADRRHPVVCADDLGALIVVARSFDPRQSQHPDVGVLLALDERTRELLDELVEADSVRAAAGALGLHHSTLQARHESLTRQLGYDPRSGLGRTRYETARLLARLV
ncbi:MAG: hypothetical protein QM626_13545 [Microbacterium sp.]|uniref:hypothetical protein n=1 Tax=Microbacterium sp. TaxID=51671 RepID=UPI0039E27D81